MGHTPHFVYKYKPIYLFSVSVLLSRQLLPRFETLEFLQAVSDRFFNWGTERYPPINRRHRVSQVPCPSPLGMWVTDWAADQGRARAKDVITGFSRSLERR